MILPAAVAAAMGCLYLWRQLHVWPAGKEAWLEEGIVMMVFYQGKSIDISQIVKIEKN